VTRNVQIEGMEYEKRKIDREEQKRKKEIGRKRGN
jgi:hypothetical protein